MPHRLHAVVLSMALFLVPSLMAQSSGTAQETKKPKKSPDVIFVPTPYEVVNEMLRMAEVDKNDTVYDLGCGDGRLVITAAKKFGARGVGIDIDPERIAESKANARKEGVTERVEFREADLFESDISEATAVTLYLLSSLNEKLRPKLVKELKPGTPIVSHDFPMGDWKPEQSMTVNAGGRDHQIYRWTVPAKASGAWQWTQPGKDGQETFKLALEQEHDLVSGTLTVNGKEMPIRNGRLHGTKLTFEAGADEQLSFEGRVNGDSLAGVAKVAGEERRWAAHRVSAKTNAAR